jgi:hypothetical protein
MMAGTMDTPRKKRGGRLLRYVIFAPIRIGWWMASRVERSTGIVFTLILGTVLLAGGIFLSSTLLGAIPGIPMIVAGGFLVLRSLY